MKFYQFDQNNSGGGFDVTDTVCHRLFIEAETLDKAVEKAEELGCYWDGVFDGRDCDCCGDRWHKPWDDEGLKFPQEVSRAKYNNETRKIDWIYETVHTIEEYAQYLADAYGWTTPDARIFYADGRVTEIFTKKDR